jgi:hypothetical protein
MTTKPPLQKILKEILTQKMKTNITTNEREILNLKRRKDKYSENSIEFPVHTTQIPK